MKRRMIATVIATFITVPMAGAATLDQLVAQTNGSMTCWQRQYDEAHLKSHPDQQVTAMTFGAEFHRHEDPEPDNPGLTLFGMSVALRDGKSGVASGGCWLGEAGQLRCGVDCDGGGVALKLRDDGSLLIDLEATGYIRMEGECGGGMEDATFPLEPGLDDKQFLLHPVKTALCEPIMPRW